MNIGIIGKLRSGKGTLAQSLQAADSRYTELSLAGPLKQDVLDMLNSRLEKYFGTDWTMTLEDLERHKGVFRPFLQWYGTDFMREFMSESSFWIDQFARQCERVNEEGKFVVVSDVRFPNEADFLNESGFLLIKVVRDDDERTSADARLGASSTEAQQHSSERFIDQITPHLVFENNGTLADVQDFARRVVELGMYA